MKSKIKNSIPFLLLLFLLCIMYGTNIGVPGITQYWSDFKLFDMQFLYTIDIYRETVSNLGSNGITHYIYYFIVDMVFMFVLFWVQRKITHWVAVKENAQCKILMLLVAVRGMLDLLEDVLLTLIFKNIIPDWVIGFVSYITLIKLLCIYIWLVVVVVVKIIVWKFRRL